MWSRQSSSISLSPCLYVRVWACVYVCQSQSWMRATNLHENLDLRAIILRFCFFQSLWGFRSPGKRYVLRTSRVFFCWRQGVLILWAGAAKTVKGEFCARRVSYMRWGCNFAMFRFYSAQYTLTSSCASMKLGATLPRLLRIPPKYVAVSDTNSPQNQPPTP